MKPMLQPYLLPSLALSLAMLASPVQAVEAPKAEDPPLRELEISTGDMPASNLYRSQLARLLSMPVSNFSMRGIYYRHGLDPKLSVQIGFETVSEDAMKLVPPPETDPYQSYSFGSNRYHLSMVTNGWIYGGAGLTYVDTAPAGYDYRLSNTLYPHAIAGLRYLYDPFVLTLEYRLGVGGPNSLGLKGGFRF